MAKAARKADAPEATRQFVTFRVDGRRYALPAEQVSEVIRTPAVARLPLGPPSLLGVANLRGEVLPVASLPMLLGRSDASRALTRAIILNGAAPAAIAVEEVEALVTVAEGGIVTTQADLAAAPGEVLAGAFQNAGEATKVLDIQSLLAAAFVAQPRAPRRPAMAGLAAVVAEASIDRVGKLISFEVGGQEFALALEAVREIVAAPEHLANLPGSEALVLGLMAYRDGLLPLLSLRGLLGLPGVQAEAAKVVVTQVGGIAVGLLVDRMRSILPADPTLIEPVSPVLSARTGGETQIASIYRGEGGRRLISILSPEQLFREDVMDRLRRSADAAATIDAPQAATQDLRFLVFRLGDDAFALPIEVVDEVATAPQQITKVPKTPTFLEGVINLRGEVLPVVDQRRRFDMPPMTGDRPQRLVVVRTERHRAGLIVDSVSEVLRSSADAIAPAPNLTGEATRLVSGVINLEEAGRIVLLLDPAELLTRAERGLLDAFADAAGPGAS